MKTSLQLDPEAIKKADDQARKWGLSRQQYINIVLKHCEIDLSVILETETLKKSGRLKSTT